MTGVALQYYTDRVDASLAQTARGIAGRHEQFCTDILGDAGESDDNRICIQLRAWCKPEGMWQIDRYTTLGADMDHAVKKEPESRLDLCFFDALEYCASFQMTQAEMGKIVLPAEEDDKDIVSFREAAKAAGQVIDLDGRLHPCAMGQILGSGFFSKADIALAKMTATQTQAKALSPTFAGATMLLPLTKKTEVMVQNGQNSIARQLKDKGDLSRLFGRAIHAGTEMVDAMSGAMDQDFKLRISGRNAVALGVLGLVTVGLYPASKIWRGDQDIMPVEGFYMARSRFARIVHDLPQSELTQKLEDFIRTAEVAFQMEHAISLLDQNKGKSVRISEKALALIDSACRLVAYNDADVQRIKQSIAQGVTGPGEFFARVAEEWNPVLSKISPNFRDNVGFSWADIYDAMYRSQCQGSQYRSLKSSLVPLHKKIVSHFVCGYSTESIIFERCLAVLEASGHGINRDKTSLVARMYAQTSEAPAP